MSFSKVGLCPTLLAGFNGAKDAALASLRPSNTRGLCVELQGSLSSTRNPLMVQNCLANPVSAGVSFSLANVMPRW